MRSFVLRIVQCHFRKCPGALTKLATICSREMFSFEMAFEAISKVYLAFSPSFLY